MPSEQFPPFIREILANAQRPLSREAEAVAKRFVFGKATVEEYLTAVRRSHQQN